MTLEEAKIINSSYKLKLNSTYGVMGSRYSAFYSPEALLHVTFTGQLTMLMLIERLTLAGIEVVSSNTDSVTYKPKGKKQKKKAEKIVHQLEKESGLVFEFTPYKSINYRDVNSYVATTETYAVGKGFFGKPNLAKNIEYPIVTEAIRKYLFDGTAMEDTINSCTDIRMFASARTVTGGALWSPLEYPNTDEFEKFIVEFEAGERKDNKALRKRNDDYKKQFVLQKARKWYLGKVVRWYYATDGRPMFYKKSGNKVPKTDEYNGVKPILDLPKELPSDIDYDAYIGFANRHLKELGL